MTQKTDHKKESKHSPNTKNEKKTIYTEKKDIPNTVHICVCVFCGLAFYRGGLKIMAVEPSGSKGAFGIDIMRTLSPRIPRRVIRRIQRRIVVVHSGITRRNALCKKKIIIALNWVDNYSGKPLTFPQHVG